SRVQRQFARYQAAQTGTQPAFNFSAAEGFKVPAPNLVAQVAAWRKIRSKADQLQDARTQALQSMDELKKQHDTMESEGASTQGTTTQASTQQNQKSEPADASQSVIASLRRLSSQQKNLSDLDRRAQDHQDLANVYANWIGLIQVDQRAL